jgi:hypothetical protein
MVYRREHDCNVSECTELTSYIRIDGKWVRIGHYGSACKQFNSLDLQQEERDRDLREKQHYIKSQLQQIRSESRERRKTMNVSESFLNVR